MKEQELHASTTLGALNCKSCAYCNKNLRFLLLKDLFDFILFFLSDVTLQLADQRRHDHDRHVDIYKKYMYIRYSLVQLQVVDCASGE